MASKYVNFAPVLKLNNPKYYIQYVDILTF